MEVYVLVILLIVDIGFSAAAIATGVIGLVKKNMGCAIAATAIGGVALIFMFFSFLTFIAGIIGLSLGIPGIVLTVNANKQPRKA